MWKCEKVSHIKITRKLERASHQGFRKQRQSPTKSDHRFSENENKTAVPVEGTQMCRQHHIDQGSASNTCQFRKQEHLSDLFVLCHKAGTLLHFHYSSPRVYPCDKFSALLRQATLQSTKTFVHQQKTLCRLQQFARLKITPWHDTSHDKLDLWNNSNCMKGNVCCWIIIHPFTANTTKWTYCCRRWFWSARGLSCAWSLRFRPSDIPGTWGAPRSTWCSSPDLSPASLSSVCLHLSNEEKMIQIWISSEDYFSGKV